MPVRSIASGYMWMLIICDIWCDIKKKLAFQPPRAYNIQTFIKKLTNDIDDLDNVVNVLII